jgi:hypothetical protein
MYAVNINDLTKFKNDPVHPVNMLLVPLLTDTIVNCEPGQIDGDAVLVSDAFREHWQALIHVIRKGSGCYRGIRKDYLRIYRKRRNGWEQI